jgi:hypothetical protein
MVSEQVEEVRGVRRRHNLNRLTFLSKTLGVAQAIKSISHISKKPRVDTPIRLFDAHQWRRLGDVSQRENGQSKESTLRQFGCTDGVMTFSGSQQE